MALLVFKGNASVSLLNIVLFFGSLWFIGESFLVLKLLVSINLGIIRCFLNIVIRDYIALIRCKSKIQDVLIFDTWKFGLVKSIIGLMNLRFNTCISNEQRHFVLLHKPRLCSISLGRLSDLAFKGFLPVISPGTCIQLLIIHELWLLDIYLYGLVQIFQNFLPLLSFGVHAGRPGFRLINEIWLSILITKNIFGLMINLGMHEYLGICRDVILNKLLEIFLSIIWRRFQSVITWTCGMWVLVI